jgi:hypothetical protein
MLLPLIGHLLSQSLDLFSQLKLQLIMGTSDLIVMIIKLTNLELISRELIPEMRVTILDLRQ